MVKKSPVSFPGIIKKPHAVNADFSVAHIVANRKPSDRDVEIERYIDELVTAYEKLAFELSDKQERAAELVVANKELAYQNKEKEDRAAELVIANHELELQNNEKEKRAAELDTANHELAFQNKEKENRAAELLIVNAELEFHNIEKEKRAAELLTANTQLIIAAENQKSYCEALRQMMFITSNQMREPLSNIIGLSQVLDDLVESPEKLREMIGYIKQSAQAIGKSTREMAAFINEQELKIKKQNI